MNRELPSTAIVLAHGRGDHCFPYGGVGALRSKYAMEVANRPLVARLVDALLAAGMERIVVAAGFRAEAVESVVAARGTRL
jgi:NDP-sugar pyrophosphorylase family protein